MAPMLPILRQATFSARSRLPTAAAFAAVNKFSSMTGLRTFSSYVVSPKEVNEALKEEGAQPRTIPLCAAWFMPNDPEKRQGIDTFKKLRMPRARFFDLDGIKDTESIYPHMLPTQETFEEAMQKLGINRDDRIVVYDAAETGLFSAPRVGWTLRLFGHEKVHILNNFRVWVQEGYPTESGDPAPVERSDYAVSSMSPELVVSFAEMKHLGKSNLETAEKDAESQIIDARPAGRWAGTDSEPRVGLPSGHIPGSISLPFTELLDPETKTLLQPEQLRQVLESKGVQPDKTTISSCGTGVTAAIIDLALEQAGLVKRDNRRLYDGGWT
ncbi:hypothetical protein KEM55_003391 [Ascosphaera atra]|nr:hypothetical protein KEM55_003391 [Ascosphaera atra]